MEELQGIQGLKALRVIVDVRGVAQEPVTAAEEVEQAVQAIAQVSSL